MNTFFCSFSVNCLNTEETLRNIGKILQQEKDRQTNKQKLLILIVLAFEHESQSLCDLKSLILSSYRVIKKIQQIRLKFS